MFARCGRARRAKFAIKIPCRSDVHECEIHRALARQTFTRWSALWGDIQVGTYTRGIIPSNRCTMQEQMTEIRDGETYIRMWKSLQHRVSTARLWVTYIAVNCIIYYMQRLAIFATLSGWRAA